MYLGEDRQSGFRILVHSHHLPLNCHCWPASSLMDFIVCNDSVHLIDPSYNTHWFIKNAEVSILVWIWTATINEEEKIIIKILLNRSTDKSNEILDDVPSHRLCWIFIDNVQLLCCFNFFSNIFHNAMWIKITF